MSGPQWAAAEPVDGGPRCGGDRQSAAFDPPEDEEEVLAAGVEGVELSFFGADELPLEPALSDAEADLRLSVR